MNLTIEQQQKIYGTSLEAMEKARAVNELTSAEYANQVVVIKLLLALNKDDNLAEGSKNLVNQAMYFLSKEPG